MAINFRLKCGFCALYTFLSERTEYENNVTLFIRRQVMCSVQLAAFKDEIILKIFCKRNKYIAKSQSDSLGLINLGLYQVRK